MPTMMLDPVVVRHGLPEQDGLGTDRASLPLNIVAQIISYISEPADLARACRTCRIFHYMCLPNLYSQVVLRSYDRIRYSTETARPEGCGGASPFTAGLEALVTRAASRYVKEFEVVGTYKELGSEDHARVGRVPDGSMMLNLLVRTAIDRMTELRTFSWNLNIKMLPVMWEMIAVKSHIDSLTVRFPATRLPSPIYTVPGMPNLKSLALLNLDPLCYPDSLSRLLCDSSNLEHLRLHWSPRMRRERESSVNLQMYFGKLLLTERKLRLRSIAMQNLYSVEHEGNFLGVYDPRYLEAMTAIDSAGGVDDEADMTFVAEPPKRLQPMPRLRFLRGNKVSRRHCQGLGKMAGLGEYYLITGRPLRDPRDGPADPATAASPRESTSSGRSPPGADNGAPSPFASLGPANGLGSAGPTPGFSGEAHPASPGGGSSFGGSNAGEAAVAAVGPAYLEQIVGRHGPTITRLLLLPHWRLSAHDAALLAKGCPHLTQLGLGLDGAAGLEVLGDALVPGLRQLTALRLLDSIDESSSVVDVARQMGEAWCAERLGFEVGRGLARAEAQGAQKKAAAAPGQCALRWVGIGEMVFEIRNAAEPRVVELEGGQKLTIKGAVRKSLRDVQDVEIWKYDRLEI